MPFYEYECSGCKYYTEVLQKLSDPVLRKCPSCGKNTFKKLVSAPVFRLKGSGWYETDFKGDKDSKRNLAGDDSRPPEGKDGKDKDAKDKDAKDKDAKDKGGKDGAAKAESAASEAAKPAAEKPAATEKAAARSRRGEPAGRAKPAAKAPAKSPAKSPAKAAKKKSRR